jgi:hypothetical protein
LQLFYLSTISVHIWNHWNFLAGVWWGVLHLGQRYITPRGNAAGQREADK